MSTFRYGVEIFARRERIWDTLIDVERWPEWTPTVKRVARLDPGPLALGSRTRLWQPKLLTTVWRVTELDPDAGLFTWSTGRPGIRVAGIHRLEPAPGGSTLVTLELKYSGLIGILMAMQLRHLNWEYITQEGQGLKTRCEQW